MTKYLLVFVAIIILTGVYFVAQKQRPQTPRTAEKLTIAMFDNPTFALVLIAQNKGYFKDENLEVTYRRIGSGISNLTDALEGNSDIGWAYETPIVRKKR